MLPSTFLVIFLTLVGYVTAKELSINTDGDLVILGYRTAHPEEAKEYADNGVPSVPTAQFRPAYREQLGSGTYLTPGRGQWRGSKTDHYCIFTADRQLFNDFNKEWIPEVDIDPDSECEVQLWNQEDEIEAYLKGFYPGEDPGLVLRLSKIEHFENTWQILIPRAVLEEEENGHRVLGLEVECSESLRDMPNIPADIWGWPKVDGEPQYRE